MYLLFNFPQAGTPHQKKEIKRPIVTSTPPCIRGNLIE